MDEQLGHEPRWIRFLRDDLMGKVTQKDSFVRCRYFSCFMQGFEVNKVILSLQMQLNARLRRQSENIFFRQ